MLSFGKYVPHQADLVTFFISVILIDTHGINPDDPRYLLSPNNLNEESMNSRSDQQGFFVASDWTCCFLSFPMIGDGRVNRSVVNVNDRQRALDLTDSVVTLELQQTSLANSGELWPDVR